jgi:sigma-B regulation protein RsbU (phosphoserine phosphatase)
MTAAKVERILAVDDDPGMRRVLSRTLSPPYQVDLARSIGEARERLSQIRFDVALIDIQLGDGDGYRLCRDIREKSPETDVILITGSHSEPDEKLYRSLEEGAFYFLFKPFERRVLRALVERCVELQRARRAKDRYARELAEDLERARRFQSSLLPRQPLRSLGWHVEGRLRSCDAVGGDLFLALTGADGTLSFAVTDVSGHGVRAAMYAGMLLSLLDTARRRNPDPETVEAEISYGVDFFESGSYATVFFGQIGSDGRLRYFNAGHPPPLLLRADGELEALKTAGIILAPLFADSRRRIGETSLAPGDRLLAFTDGVYESLDPGEHQWGLDALRTAIRETRALPPDEALDAIMDRVVEHASGRPPGDDQTLVVVDRTGT